MHEVSLCQHLIRIVTETANERGLSDIQEVVVDVDAMACVDPAALAQAFDAIPKPDILSEAALRIEMQSSEAQCPICHRRVVVESRTQPCVHCGHWPMSPLTTGDIRVRSVAVRNAV